MPETLARQVIADADRCVKCALCLPHCPTYGISGNESESPRGRIALMRALADESLEADPGLVRHLDQCLACRNCEPVCPALVPYGRLIDHGRQLLIEKHRSSWFKRLGLWLVTRPVRVRILTALVRAGQSTGLTRFIAPAGRLPRLQQTRRWPQYFEAEAAKKGEVGLFLGCVARVLDQTTLENSVLVLNAFGYAVHVPAKQTCCGALHRHAGHAGYADRLAAINQQAFGNIGVETVISTATGCGAELSEQAFANSGHVDICTFLNRTLDGQALALKPLPARIVVYAPCTGRNVLRQGDAGIELLRHIPDAETVAIDDTATCCGAAGSYVLEHGDIADKLGATLAERIAREKPDYVATTNIGCTLHLADHLRRSGSKAEVLHPVSLIARQLCGLAKRYNGVRISTD